jgi:hypothetical protein
MPAPEWQERLPGYPFRWPRVLGRDDTDGRRWLVSAYDMSERSAKERTDTLTKLGNRLMFHERLTELLANPDLANEGRGRSGR